MDILQNIIKDLFLLLAGVIIGYAYSLIKDEIKQRRLKKQKQYLTKLCKIIECDYLSKGCDVNGKCPVLRLYINSINTWNIDK